MKGSTFLFLDLFQFVRQELFLMVFKDFNFFLKPRNWRGLATAL